MRRINSHRLILIILAVLIAALVAANIAACARKKEQVPSDTVTSETTTAKQTTTAAQTTETESTTPADTTAPVITGVTDRVVHIGETIAYKKNIVVTDDTDPAPKLEVNADGVDISTVGDYTVIYTATDASLNYSVVTATIKVVPQEDVTTAQAEALADDVLSRIVTDDMTDSQKLDAVWWYVHELGYTDIDYGEPEEYLNNGFYFITRMMGNCRCVYGASRILLERLGYKCMMMRNREDAAQTHYWNLVSLDDGETWYHFDPVCWGWEEEYVICMVSDEWILSYSEWHNMETYDWDPEGVPATPDRSYDPDGYFGDRMLFDESGFYWEYYGDWYEGGTYQGHNYPGLPYSWGGYYDEEDYYYVEDYDDYYEEDYYDYDEEYEEYYEEDYSDEYTSEEEITSEEIPDTEEIPSSEDGE
ncbi:MAG: DUF5011 domain-containing protein [Lachnospiraceae bacterium]|nr:DUF5011 domain-containing protein [Lachnospiraceae bacterium]